MTALSLTPAARKAKRAEAHRIEPTVMIGAAGLTPAVRREVDAALQAHGLIKVKLAVDDRQARAALMQELAEGLEAAPVQQIGKLVVLWRPIVAREADPRDDRMPGPRIVKVVKFSKSGNHRPQIKKVKVLGNMRLSAGGQLKRARKPQRSVKKAAQQSR